MKKIFVFTGPTIPAADGRAVLDAVYLPPVAEGDVLRASHAEPWAIGIIDGTFQRQPAVWHKEILWAMTRGIHVFGSASMGALRAAELATFGMDGVGRIFDAFHGGELEDDDEVAVVHGPADSGYRPLSEAMVNVRATLEAAVAAGVIGTATGAELIGITKDLFYPRRTYATVLDQARKHGLPPVEIDALAAWLPTGKVDRKREDALAMLRLMRSRSEADPGPKHVRFQFQHTDAWEGLRRRCRSSTGGETGEIDALLDELRLQGEPAYRRQCDLTWIRLLALEMARQEGAAIDPTVVQETLDAFRRLHGLLKPDQVERWLADQELHGEELMRLMADETRVRRVLQIHVSNLGEQLPHQLRITGDYGPLAARVRAKAEMLTARGLENPGLADVGLSEDELWHWYFEERLGRSRPSDLDGYARSLGLADQGALRRVVVRELCFSRLQPAE